MTHHQQHAQKRATDTRQWLVTACPTLTLTVTAKTAQEATQQFLDLIDDDYPGISHHIENQPDTEEAL